MRVYVVYGFQQGEPDVEWIEGIYKYKSGAEKAVEELMQDEFNKDVEYSIDNKELID